IMVKLYSLMLEMYRKDRRLIMKKLVFSTLVVASLVAGCSNNDNELKKIGEEVKEPTINNTLENNNTTQSTSSNTLKEITPEQAQESMSQVVEKAKENK